MKRRFRIRCTYVIEVETEGMDEDYPVQFYFEENHCPGTGHVGAAFDRVYEYHNKNGTCWACALGGECKILEEITGKDS